MTFVWYFMFTYWQENVRVLGSTYQMILADIGKCLFFDVSDCSGLDCNYYLIVHLGRQEMSYELMHRFLSILTNIRRRKMSVLAQLHVVIEFTVEYCVLYKLSQSHNQISENVWVLWKSDFSNETDALYRGYTSKNVKSCIRSSLKCLWTPLICKLFLWS